MTERGLVYLDQDGIKLAGSCEHIMNIQIPKVRGHSWLTGEMLASQKGLKSWTWLVV
jgi:hypothetical protein